MHTHQQGASLTLGVPIERGRELRSRGTSNLLALLILLDQDLLTGRSRTKPRAATKQERSTSYLSLPSTSLPIVASCIFEVPS
jgi:hypothetical protein